MKALLRAGKRRPAHSEPAAQGGRLIADEALEAEAAAELERRQDEHAATSAVTETLIEWAKSAESVIESAAFVSLLRPRE